jgi:hypothetical protein
MVRRIAEAEEAVQQVRLEGGLLAHAAVAHQRGQLSARQMPEEVELGHAVARLEVAGREHRVPLVRRLDAPEAIGPKRNLDGGVEAVEHEFFAVRELGRIRPDDVASQLEERATAGADGEEGEQQQARGEFAPRQRAGARGAGAAIIRSRAGVLDRARAQCRGRVSRAAHRLRKV